MRSDTMTKVRWFGGLVAGAAAAAALAFAGSASADHHAGQAKDKAVVGEAAPNFTLSDTEGARHTLSDFAKDDKIVVLEWWNPRCPFVVKHHDGMTTMEDLASKYADDNVVWIKVNSTNPEHRDYGADKKAIKDWNVTTPVLLDSDGYVGQMYGARTTPHMYVIDAEGVLRYAGAIDSHRSPNAPSDREKSRVVNYVDQALGEIISGKEVSQPETKPYGCSVKYAK